MVHAANSRRDNNTGKRAPILPSAGEAALRVFLESKTQKGAALSNVSHASLASRTTREGLANALRMTIKWSAMQIALHTKARRLGSAVYSTESAIVNVFIYMRGMYDISVDKIILMYAMATLPKDEQLAMRGFAYFVTDFLSRTFKRMETKSEMLRWHKKRVLQALEDPSEEWQRYTETFRGILTGPHFPAKIRAHFGRLLRDQMALLIRHLPDAVKMHAQAQAEPGGAVERFRHLGSLIDHLETLIETQAANDKKISKNGYAGQTALATNNIRKLMVRYGIAGDPSSRLEEVIQTALARGDIKAKHADKILEVYRWTPPPVPADP